jgi:hypothetical protein
MDNKIVFLINSVYYYLQRVFIICKNDKFTLVVYRDSNRSDRQYDTMRAAKIAFTKMYRDTVIDGLRAEWSGMYQPKDGFVESNTIT